MSRRIFSPDTVHKPGTVFSHVAIVGDVIYLAGQSPHERSGAVVDPTDPARQFRQVFDNIREVLKAAESSFQDVVRLTVYLRKREHVPLFWEIAQENLGRHRPAISLVIVEGLAKPELLLEVDTIAVKDGAALG